MRFPPRNPHHLGAPVTLRTWLSRPSRGPRPVGLQAATVAEAFQATADAHPDRVALRTKGDEFSITWREYADRVEATRPAASPALGLGRGDTLAIMLTNRPEFHWFDAAALHLGATPFSLYNTYTPEQIQYQVEDAGRGSWSPRRPSPSGSRA